jgi:hypothetical protein
VGNTLGLTLGNGVANGPVLGMGSALGGALDTSAGGALELGAAGGSLGGRSQASSTSSLGGGGGAGALRRPAGNLRVIGGIDSSGTRGARGICGEGLAATGCEEVGSAELGFVLARSGGGGTVPSMRTWAPHDLQLTFTTRPFTRFSKRLGGMVRCFPQESQTYSNPIGFAAQGSLNRQRKRPVAKEIGQAARRGGRYCRVA